MESGSDNVLENITIATCRDWGIRAGNAAQTIQNCHLYGMDVGILLDDSGISPGWGSLEFTGKTEVETCWVSAVRNLTHAGTSFQHLKVFNCPAPVGPSTSLTRGWTSRHGR